MTIIDPFYLYLILQLDSIKDALSGASFVLFAGAFLLVVVSIFVRLEAGYSWVSEEKKESYRAQSQKLQGHAKRAAVVGLAAFSVNAFLPTSERMAVLVVLPAITNSATIQAEAKEVYELAKRGLSSLVATTGEAKSDEAKE